MPRIEFTLNFLNLLKKFLSMNKFLSKSFRSGFLKMFKKIQV